MVNGLFEVTEDLEIIIRSLPGGLHLPSSHRNNVLSRGCMRWDITWLITKGQVCHPAREAIVLYNPKSKKICKTGNQLHSAYYFCFETIVVFIIYMLFIPTSNRMVIALMEWKMKKNTIFFCSWVLIFNWVV